MRAMAGKSSPAKSHLGLAVVLFVTGIFGAIVTGLTALVLWLSSWIGSISLAALAVCILFGILAAISYELGIRTTVERFSAKLETISEVAGMFQHVRHWFEKQWLYLLQLAALLLNDREQPSKPKEKEK